MLIIAGVTELAKHFPLWGCIIAALPFVSLRSLGWLAVQGGTTSQLTAFTKGVIWGLPATMALLFVVWLSLKQSLSFGISILFGAGGWAIVLLLQQGIVKWLKLTA